MVIYHNVGAIKVDRYINEYSSRIDKSMERLASGKKLNRAGDNASDFAVAQKMETQIRGLSTAQRNAMMGLSFLETAESALGQVNDILQRIRVLALQSANGIYSTDDRKLMQMEVNQLIDEIDRISTQAQFNRLKLLDGSVKEMFFHVGPNKDQRIVSKMFTMNAKSLGLITAKGKLSIETPEAANNAIGIIDKALDKVNEQRATLGAYYNRMDYTIKALSENYESMVAAESRIMDTDMAKEVIELTKNQVLLQSSMAVLSQANFKPQLVLQLLG